MRKILLFIIVSIFTTIATYAQNYNPSPQLSVGINAGVAVGTVSTYYPAASELTLKLTYPIAHSPASFTFSTGYTFYSSNQGYDAGYSYGGFGFDYYSGGYYSGPVASFIPVMAGVKIYVAKRLFVKGEAGASFNVNTYPQDYTGKTTAFIYSPGAGYTLPLGYSRKNSFDFSLAYENRVEPGGGYTQVTFGAAFNFGL